MVQPSDGIALVTGASSGIGAATVRRLRADGWPVMALARRKERLDALAEETGCDTHALDLTDGAATEAFARELAPSVVVNNAGSGQGIAGLDKTGADDIELALMTNVAAPFRLLRGALPAMRERGRGHVVNIGSIAGLYPIVSSLYGASKGAVHLMTQNLRVELKGSGVRVTEIAPGRVTSEFYDASGIPDADRARMTDTGITEMRPEDVADAILYALGAPAHVNIGLIELTPTEQALGGVQMMRAEKGLG